MGRRKNRRTADQRSIHNPAIPISSAAILEYLGGGGRSSSGISVTPRTALGCSPVWQAIDILTGDVSRTPLLTYLDNGRSRERAVQHPVYRLLRRSAGRMTSNLWLARILGHALLYGDGYSRIIWRGTRVVELEWHHRDNVLCQYERGRRYYIVKYDADLHGKEEYVRVPWDDMFHLVGLTLEELGGLSLIDHARNTIGRMLAAESYEDDFYQNFGMPPGWFETPLEWSTEAKTRFINEWTAKHQGHGKRWKPAVLEEGMTWKTAAVNPHDAMLIDALKWGVKDVSRFFNLPPHKLGDDSKVSYNSLEQEEKAYRDSSLGKWFSRFEFEANEKLFLPSEQDAGYYCEFLQDNFAKADTATRYAAYQIAIINGIMSRNEVRARENLNPYDGGDEFLTPVQGTPPQPDGGEQNQQGPPADDADDDDDDVRSAVILRELVVDRLEHAARLLVNAAGRAAKKGGNFLAAVNAFDERFRPAIVDKIRPAVRSATVGRALADDPVKATADRLIDEAITLFVESSECRPELLAERVMAAGDALLSRIPDMADDLVFAKGKGAA